MSHDVSYSTAPLAAARDPLRSVPASRRWFWLVRPGAVEQASAVGLALFEGLPGLLVRPGEEGSGHG